MGKAKNIIKQDVDADFSLINIQSAGIDISADRHWVSVPVGRDKENVRSARSLVSLPNYMQWRIG